MTDKCQPLDTFTFGCMKSIARAEYLKLVHHSPKRRITKEHALQILQTAWDRLFVTTVESAWSIYQDQEHQTGITQTHDSGQSRKAASTTTHRVFARYEGIAIASVLAFVTEEKPLSQ
jgi:ribonuclease HII